MNNGNQLDFKTLQIFIREARKVGFELTLTRDNGLTVNDQAVDLAVRLFDYDNDSRTIRDSLVNEINSMAVR